MFYFNKLNTLNLNHKNYEINFIILHYFRNNNIIYVLQHLKISTYTYSDKNVNHNSLCQMNLMYTDIGLGSELSYKMFHRA